MSDYVLAIAVPLASLAIIFIWVPLLNLICPPCATSFAHRYFQEAMKARASLTPTPD
jgi:hypothetical protein